jgi:hypothetical protein
VREIAFSSKCGHQLSENGERNRRLNPIRRNQKCWIVLKESAFGHRLESRKFEGLFGMEESH